MQALFDDRNQQVNGNRNPDLGIHRIFRVAVKGLDSQMLLDPFEEKFDLPSAPLQLGDGQGRQRKIVGEKRQ